MTKPKIAITINERTIEVLEEASKVWAGQAGNRSALIGTILDEWSHNREENSKRGSLKRLEVHADQSAIVLDEILTILRCNEREHVVGLVTAALKKCGVDVSIAECILQELADA